MSIAKLSKIITKLKNADYSKIGKVVNTPEFMRKTQMKSTLVVGGLFAAGLNAANTHLEGGKHDFTSYAFSVLPALALGAGGHMVGGMLGGALKGTKNLKAIAGYCGLAGATGTTLGALWGYNTNKLRLEVERGREELENNYYDDYSYPSYYDDQEVDETEEIIEETPPEETEAVTGKEEIPLVKI